MDMKPIVNTKSRIVVIGAGIVGNSIVYHLARLGWTDITQIDKGPLPNPGGSTGHASNFIFPVDHTREMCLRIQESVRQYKELGVFTQSGGIEVARTPERMQELARRMASSQSWGIHSELIGPERIKEMVPFVNERLLVGGFHTPGVGVVDSVKAGALMREYALEKSVLTVRESTEVHDITVENGGVKAVVTDKDTIQADYVVIACGLWSPRLARMAGASIPLVPAVHQLVSFGPVPILEETGNEIGYPIVRDMDSLMYERQHHGSMEVGSYGHRPILHSPDEIPSIEDSPLSPTEAPFTEEDFKPQMKAAIELMPDILQHENGSVHYKINGLLSYTPDGLSILGETPEVRNLWSAAAVWIREAPAVGRVIGEWLTYGVSEMDAHKSDVARFYDHQRCDHHVRARVNENFIKSYGIVHPFEQDKSNRRVRLSPFYARQEALGAVFFEMGGWERPQWYEANKGLLHRYADKITEREAEWDSRWWSPIINAEHLAMRERAAMIDLSAFNIFDIEGSGVLDYVQRMTVNQMDVKVGRAVYTPILTHNGGFRADLTITRTAENKYRVVSASADGSLDKYWFRKHMPNDGSVQFSDLSSAHTCIGLWGPRAPEMLAAAASDDVGIDVFPWGTAREIRIGTVRVWALRISYVGENGWELHMPIESGLYVWDTLWEEGRKFDAVAAGAGVYGTTARLEKGYRFYGAELHAEYNPVEAGLARPKVKKADFIGKEAYLKARAEEPAAVLCTLTVDDHTSKSGVKRYNLGNEPILSPDGKIITDRLGRVSTAYSTGAGPSVGKHLILSYLPPEYAEEGTKLKLYYMDEHYPVTVAVAGSRPLFDPDNARMRGLES